MPSYQSNIMLSLTEENYLKAVYRLSDHGRNTVSTNTLSDHLKTKPASVSDMLKKLSAKELIDYERYQGVNISDKGKTAALEIIRKHRLWEVFLVEKLNFHWNEVHEVAEQLEHIKSPLLIQRLDEFLGFPKKDPHGAPIPNEFGEMKEKPQIALSDAEVGAQGLVVSVKDVGNQFLPYLDKLGIYIGAKIKITDRVAFDGSSEILIDDQKKAFLSKNAGQNILMSI